ncbi:MAG TPA: polyprenyl synthetase family protein [Cyclobacteriaceae bacterium]|nr:polyprenyl synthetase family protein [Cyclobacteriaceae bacterium]
MLENNKHYLKLIEKEIRKQRSNKKPKTLYQPIDYLMGIGGKRIRPLMCLLAYNLYKEKVEKIIPYAVAIEVFHNFTLMHDDIMDNAPLRRGKKTVHEKWNTNTAILSGDVMLVKAYEIFSGLDAETLRQVLIAFNQCAAEVCEGQQWDMDFEKEKKVSEAQYIEMIRLKTAVLLGFSMELGAILAKAPKEDCKALRDFGQFIGIAFQLKDDLLDVYADKAKFGKQVGGDIIANKKTYLLIKALQEAKGKDKKELESWLRKKSFSKKEKVKAITQIYDNAGVRKFVEAKINHHFNKGFKALNSLHVADEKKMEMLAFTEALMNRDK